MGREFWLNDRQWAVIEQLMPQGHRSLVVWGR
jgi:hypothetical protein